MTESLTSSLNALIDVINMLQKEISSDEELLEDEPQCSPVYARYLDTNDGYSLVIQDEKLVVPENYITIPTGADTFVVFESGTSYFWKHADTGNYFKGASNTSVSYPEWVNTLLTAKEYVAAFSSTVAKIKWEDNKDQNSVGCTPNPELHEYLDVSLDYGLVLRTQYEAAQSNSTLIPVPKNAEMAAVFTNPDQPLCFYKQVGDTVFAKDSKDTDWVTTYWKSLDALKEHVQHYNYEYWVRNTPEVQEYLDKAESCVSSIKVSEKGQKYDSGKLRFSLIPKGVLEHVIRVLEFGAAKYSKDNWKHVDNATERYYDAAMRHLNLWFAGETNDSETGESHLSHAICCLLFLLWLEQNKQVLN